MDKDDFVPLIRKAINSLFLSQPERTSLGIVFGISIQRIYESLLPYLTKKYDNISFPFFSDITIALFTIFIFNINLLMKRKKFPEEIEIALKLIKEAEIKGKLSKVHVKQMYLNLVSQVINSVQINEKMEKEIKNWK